jgi:hypothetical protein
LESEEKWCLGKEVARRVGNCTLAYIAHSLKMHVMQVAMQHMIQEPLAQSNKERTNAIMGSFF